MMFKSLLTGLSVFLTIAATGNGITISAAFQRGSNRTELVLSVEGSGGRVGIGDTLALAKKAFPAPPGAHVVGAANFAVFQRPAKAIPSRQLAH